MTKAIEAARTFIRLEDTAALGVAANFARQFENDASEEEFDAFLAVVEAHFESVPDVTA
jgi:hypothetical protein